MGFFRFVIWSSLCIGFGIFLGTFEVSGRTPWQLVQGAFEQSSPQLSAVRDGAEDVVNEVKKKVANDTRPAERHSEEDKKAIDAIIAKRKG